MSNNMEKEIFEVYVDDIIPNRFQPRLTFDEKALNELANSIKQHGIIQPLVVRKVQDKYEIIAGERRYKAAQLAGLQKVPVVIMNLDDEESAEVAVVENIQRRDLTALEEAESYKKLLDKGYLTQDQLAARMGKTQATISNKLRLLALDDEVKDALLNGKISERHARSLLSLKNPMEQRDVLNKIISNRLTVRQTDELIKTMSKDTVETLDFNPSIQPNIQPPQPPIFSSPSPPSDNRQMFGPPSPAASPSEPTNDNSQMFDPSSPAISTPDIPVQTPKAQDFPPIENVVEPAPPTQSIEKDQINIDPIANIDVDRIKQTAVDINPVDPPADVDALLGVKPPVDLPPEPTPEAPATRFIPSLEDQAVNMEVNDLTDQAPQPHVVQSSPEQHYAPSPEPTPAPETFTDTLVQEFRQNNNVIDPTDNVSSGDLKSAINILRETTNALEKKGFEIDVEEFDFESLYQIIIKINKQ